MSRRHNVYVALGSNSGDRQGYLELGRQQLDSVPETVVVSASGILETDPVGYLDQPRFLNQMVLLETSLSPRRLLRECQRIEQMAKRTRTFKWAPRTLDLDIVRFDGTELNTPELTIPHPELSKRWFWQAGISELEAALSKPAGRVPGDHD